MNSSGVVFDYMVPIPNYLTATKRSNLEGMGYDDYSDNPTRRRYPSYMVEKTSSRYT
jgi:hypothetical protein